jgi:hypothetical protein
MNSAQLFTLVSYLAAFAVLWIVLRDYRGEP